MYGNFLVHDELSGDRTQVLVPFSWRGPAMRMNVYQNRMDYIQINVIVSISTITRAD